MIISVRPIRTVIACCVFGAVFTGSVSTGSADDAGADSPWSAAGLIGRSFASEDSITLPQDERPDARQCLQQLVWVAEDFKVQVQPATQSGVDAVLRFPSARPMGVPHNDEVAVEWYACPTGSHNQPAVVVVHESGRSMKVGRMIARGLRDRGVHAFMVQLPFYGLRRPTDKSANDQPFEAIMGQGIADVRRTYDAVRVLPGIDANRISLQGTSLGGFLAATTAGLDDHFFRTFVLLAGGDLSQLIETGRNETQAVRQLLRDRGLDQAARHALLNQFEPNRLAHRIDASRLWLFTATFDTTVPPRHADSFAAAAGLKEEHHVRMPATHYSGIIFLPQILKVIATEARSDESPTRRRIRPTAPVPSR